MYTLLIVYPLCYTYKLKLSTMNLNNESQQWNARNSAHQPLQARTRPLPKLTLSVTIVTSRVRCKVERGKQNLIFGPLMY